VNSGRARAHSEQELAEHRIERVGDDALDVLQRVAAGEGAHHRHRAGDVLPQLACAGRVVEPLRRGGPGLARVIDERQDLAARLRPEQLLDERRRLPDALLMTWRSLPYSPCTSLTTCTGAVGSVRIASRLASSARAADTFG